MEQMDAALLILRVWAGFVLIAHGINHGRTLDGTASWFESKGFRKARLNAFLSFANEIAIGIGLILGLLTSVAAAALAAEGVRHLVSAGGSGTFNAVLEGCCDSGVALGEIRLGFLRKGSADLIGKVLGMPDAIEAAVDVTYWRCAAESQRLTVPIGRPIANTQIHILDAAGAPAPIGTPPTGPTNRLPAAHIRTRSGSP